MSGFMTVVGLLLIPFGTAIPLNSFYPFGSAVGDAALPSNDDGSSSTIPLQTPFLFFGTSYTNIFVNNNGDLTFNAAYSTYTPLPFPIQGNPMIAPFFADVDTRGTGKVWYRTTTNSALLAKAVNDIPSIIAGPNFTPLWLFIATWDHVGYFNNHTDKTNTFQCILATDNVRSFAIFQYADGLMQWTTGDASGGSGGLGGTPAQVGFNAGDSVSYANVPGSRTPAIINITSTSNVLVPGQWIFQVQNAIITSTVPSSPLNFTLSPVPHSPYQLSAMWSAPSVTYGNITAYTVYCNTSATQAYPEQVFGPNIPTTRSVVNGTTLTAIFSTGLIPYTQYQCYVTAANSYGEGAGSMVAAGWTDESTPSQPRSVSLAAVPGSPNQLTASWTPSNPKNGIITAYTVYCNTSATQAYPEQVIGPNIPTIRSVVNGTTLSTILTGLIPYTQYNCYVSANTSVGEGPSSQVVNTKTSESVPSPPLIVSLAAVPGSLNQLTASWNPPIPRNGIITAYTLYCNTSATQAYPEQLIGPNIPTIRSVVNGTTLTAIFNTGLNPFTQYNCYVTANTSVGEGPPSQVLNTKTSESAPSQPWSVSLAAVPGSPNQLTATWTPPIPKNGIITAYTVYCNTSATQVYPEQVIGPNIPTTRSVVNGTTLTAIFNTGLSPFTQYNCYVTANTSVGEGPSSQVVNTKTSESVPSPPLSVSLAAVPGSLNQLTTTWNPPIPKNGIITAYTVYCNTSVNQVYPEQVIGPNIPTIRSVVNGTTLSTIFNTGLNPFTQYNCYVTANTSVGEGPPSQVVNTKTSESVPSPPLIVFVAGSPNQLNVTWTPPIPKNGIITAYTVYCNTSANQAYPEQVIGPNMPTISSVVSGMTQTITFSTGLSPFTQYNCYVTANSSVGEGRPSQVVMIGTGQSVPSPPLSVSLALIPGSANQLLAVWTPPIPKNGIITAYTVYCNTSATQAYPEQVIGPNIPTIRSVVNGTTLSAVISGLTSSTYYECFVTANTSAGEGIASHIVTNRTDESIPGPVVGIKLLCSTFTTITLMWQKPILSNGVILQYYISSIPFTSTTSQNIVTASQLVANTNYNFSIAACTVKRCSYPVFLQARTAPIPNITGVSAVALNQTAVHVSWMPLSLPSDGTLVGYTVYIQQDGLKSLHIPGGATQVDIINLDFSMFYEVTIVAEISILGQSQNVNSSQVVYISPSQPTDPAAPTSADISKVTTNAVAATLTVIIVLLLILLVIAIVVTALIARRRERVWYNITASSDEDRHALTEVKLY